jgi:hypothetical protein
MLCTFEPDGQWMRCACGNTMRVVPGFTRYRMRCRNSPPRTEFTPPPPVAPPQTCPHLAGPTDESVLVFGCGCGSTKKNGCLTQVFECDLHQRCVPSGWTAKGTHLADETIKRCSQCADHPDAAK